MTNATEPSAPDRKAQDTTFLIVVGALLLLIIVTLAILWVTERRGRQRAEAEAASAKRISDALKNAIASYAIEGMGAGTKPAGGAISRADTFSREANVDGRARAVFMVSAEAGRRIGFLPGDIIEVGNVTTTQASTRDLLPGDRIIEVRGSGTAPVPGTTLP